MLYILSISKKIQQDQMNSLSHKEKGREKRKVERQAYARLLKTHLDAQVNSVLEHINALVLSFCEQRQTTR